MVIYNISSESMVLFDGVLRLGILGVCTCLREGGAMTGPGDFHRALAPRVAVTPALSPIAR